MAKQQAQRVKEEIAQIQNMDHKVQHDIKSLRERLKMNPYN